MFSDWWSHILVGATAANPNLDDPTNVATLRRIAKNLDLVVIVDPFWHDVGSQVRDRLRQYAAEQDSQITCLRYMGSIYTAWADQGGDMQLVPSAGRVTTAGVVQNGAALLKSGGVPMVGRGSVAHLIDPGTAAARDAAKANALQKAAGWDGIFIDEVADNYSTFRADNTKVADGYPVTGSMAWCNAKAAFVAEVTAHLVANGVQVGANITPYTTWGDARTYAQQVCEAAPGLTWPYIEAEWCADWGRAVIGTSSGSWGTHQDVAAFLAWCANTGRQPVPNVYSNDPAIIDYGVGQFLAHAGQDAYFSAHCPGPDDGEEHKVEPVTTAAVTAAGRLGAPTSAPVGAEFVTRKYQGGRVATNPTSGPRSLALDGYYAAPGESGRTVTAARTLQATTSLVLEGDDFGVYRQVNGKKGRSPHLFRGGRWHRIHVPDQESDVAFPSGDLFPSPSLYPSS